MSTHINTLETGSHDHRARKVRVSGAGHLLRTIALWQERARQRRALAELSDHHLKDIGISRADAMREAGKSFWRE